MFKRIDAELTTITPEKAAELIKFNNLPHQRTLRQGRAAFLGERIKAGKFRTGEIALARVAGHDGVPAGPWMIVNGQHQLTAVINTGLPIEVTFDRFECDSIAEIAELFRTFDNPVSSRTQPELVRIEHGALDLPWSARVSELAVTGLSAVYQDPGTPTPDKVGLLRDHLKEAGFVAEVLGRRGTAEEVNQSRHLRKGIVVAVMIQTFNLAPLEALGFWENVRDGEMMKGTNPAMLLRDYLMSIRSMWNGKIATTKMITAHCVSAWNNHRRGRSLKKLYVKQNAKTPKLI